MSLLLSQSLCDIQTHSVVEVTVVDLFVDYHLSHLAGVAASPEIDKHDDSVDK